MAYFSKNLSPGYFLGLWKAPQIWSKELTQEAVFYVKISFIHDDMFDTFTISTFLPECSFMLKSYRVGWWWPMLF